MTSATAAADGYTSGVPFDPEYVSNVLKENFKDAQVLFLEPLLKIHYAHLVMLADTGILSTAEARRIRDALDSIPVEAVRRVAYDGSCEDLFFHVERLIADACGED